ncbi:hypothetical protein ACLOJK_014172 [Asimina triloba]
MSAATNTRCTTSEIGEEKQQHQWLPVVRKKRNKSGDNVGLSVDFSKAMTTRVVAFRRFDRGK